MINFVNLTPHDITVVGDNTKIAVIPAAGITARVSQSYVNSGKLNDIPIVETHYGDIIFLNSSGEKISPEEAKKLIEGRYVIVSALVAPKADELIRLGAKGVFAPDTGRALRDEQGRVIGVPALLKLA